LNENISFLRSGGDVTPSSSSSSPSSLDNIFLTPLSAKYLDKWYEINENRIALDKYVVLLGQDDDTSTTAAASTANDLTTEPQIASAPREVLKLLLRS
jgi:hypothetical protein